MLLSIISLIQIKTLSNFDSIELIFIVVLIFNMNKSFNQYYSNNISLKELSLARIYQVTIILIIWISSMLINKFIYDNLIVVLDSLVMVIYTYTFTLVKTVSDYDRPAYVKMISSKWNILHYMFLFLPLLIALMLPGILPLNFIYYKYFLITLSSMILILNIVYIEKVNPKVDR